MDEEGLLRRRAAEWVRLHELCERAERGIRRMSGDEVTELVRLYRQTSNDLATMASQSANTEVTSHLNGLVLRAYGQIYQRPTRPFAESLRSSVAHAAQVVRRRAWCVCLAGAVFFAGCFSSSALLSARPDLRSHLVPAEMEPLFETWKSGRFDKRQGGESLAMTAFYASNNPRVGILLHSLGLVTFGVMTAYVLWTNGALLGSLMSDMAGVGRLGFLLVSVLPHGVSEIGGLWVSGAGGFVLGWALLNPGRLSRGESVWRSGRDALALLVTGLVMILAAAPIEGFFSFNPSVPPEAKAAFGMASLVAWAVFFARHGRGMDAA